MSEQRRLLSATLSKVCQGLASRLPKNSQKTQDVMDHIWKPILEPLLERLDNGVIAEFGSKDGHGHEHISDYCRRTRARFHVVNPPTGYDTDNDCSGSPDPLLFGHGLGLQLVDKNPDVILTKGSDWHAITPELGAW